MKSLRATTVQEARKKNLKISRTLVGAEVNADEIAQVSNFENMYRLKVEDDELRFNILSKAKELNNHTEFKSEYTSHINRGRIFAPDAFLISKKTNLDPNRIKGSPQTFNKLPSHCIYVISKCK